MNKPAWEMKISQPDIVAKWKKEIGEDSKYIDLIIALLKLYINKRSTKYNDYDSGEYKWILNLTIDPDVLSVKCNCGCKICIGEENYSEAEAESDESSEAEAESEDSDECTCAGKIEQNCKTFLNRYTSEFTSCDNSCLHNAIKMFHGKSGIIDYHPGSHNQVVDIVHPSMYCFVNKDTDKDTDTDKLFQWLPAEFNINSGKTTIASYINSIHTTYSDLYARIASTFDTFVPHFNNLLTNLQSDGIWNPSTPFTSLLTSNLQVIVKIADIRLTPDNPVHNGGNWHLEGLPNEKIIATGISYYDMENITESYLEFRTTYTSGMDIDYPQSCSEYVKLHSGNIGGHDDDGRLFVDLGKIKTTKDMCLVFPNFLQHKVTDFTLLDHKIPGSRKLLVFFLVDPTNRIMSTRDIPEQFVDPSILLKLNDTKSELIYSLVAPYINFIPRIEAENYRDLLMFQRKFEISDQNKFYQRSWSMCEH